MRARLECRAEKRHDETGVGSVHEYVARVLGRQCGHLLLVAGIELHGAPGFAGRVLRPGEVVVGDDEIGELTACGDPGEGRADSAGADEQDAHTGDPSPETDRTNGTSGYAELLQLKS